MTCSNKVGRYVAIRRYNTGISDNYYTAYEMRLYQSPNLLQEIVGVQISAPTPSDPRWAATNLLTNLENRQSSSFQASIVDDAGSTGTHKSCFMTGQAQLSSNGHKLEITINLGAVYFLHSILVVQDLWDGWHIDDMKDPLKYFQNFEIHIGSSSNYALNPKCADGPFLQTSDPKSYVNYSFYGSSTGKSWYNTVSMWKFGHEAWCNMEGQYMSIVADLSSLAGQTSSSAPNGYEMSICSLGIFGTQFVRTGSVPAAVAVTQATTETITINKITARSDLALGNTLYIKLRQKPGSSFSWVTFTDQTLSTRVNFAPSTSVAPGDYTIVLESYDNNGGVFSTLKTDTITVQVRPPQCKQALSHAFDTANVITVVQEYQPTIYFPEKLFSGPHTYAGFNCAGTYTQTITMVAPVAGVVITDQPTGSDLRPSIQLRVTSPTLLTLTFSGRYQHQLSATDLNASFTQKYQLKTVFQTAYLDQPALINSMPVSALTYSIPPARTGATPPTQVLITSSYTVTYAFKAGTADSLGNIPPAIVPVPYTGFTSAQIVKGKPSLGTTFLSDPEGVFNVVGTGYAGSFSSGSIQFACQPWTMNNEGTSSTVTINFANSVEPNFKASIVVRCAYQGYPPPYFSPALPTVVLTAGTSASWTLPPIVEGPFPPVTATFSAAPQVATYLTYLPLSKKVTFAGYMYTDALTSSSVSFMLTDAENILSGPYTQTLEMQPLACSQVFLHAFETSELIEVVLEYEPTIYFPETLFSGPHTYSGYPCKGTYTQSITIDAPVAGVVLTDHPSGPDRRPRVEFRSPPPTVFTLTFSARFQHVTSSDDITASFEQRYQVKSAFSTEYLEQPSLTTNLTAEELSFLVHPTQTGANPQVQTLQAKQFFVNPQSFKMVRDPLGNIPPAVTPKPFALWTSAQLQLAKPLGKTYYQNGPGVYEAVGFQGKLGQDGLIAFTCDSWTPGVAGNRVAKSLLFKNSVQPGFSITIAVTCVYQENLLTAKISGSLLRKAPIAEKPFAPVILITPNDKTKLTLNFVDPLAKALELGQGDSFGLKPSGLEITVHQNQLPLVVTIDEIFYSKVGFGSIMLTTHGSVAQDLWRKTESTPPLEGVVKLEVADVSPGGLKSLFEVKFRYEPSLIADDPVPGSESLTAGDKAAVEASKKMIVEKILSMKASLAKKSAAVAGSRPTVAIKSITQSGTLLLTFTKNMFVSDTAATPHLRDLESTGEVTGLDREVYLSLLDSHLRLNYETDSDETEPPKFTREIVSFTDTMMEIQLDFERPPLVSAESTHRVSVTFIDSSLYFDMTGTELEQGYTTNAIALPRQFTPGAEASFFESLHRLVTPVDIENHAGRFILSVWIAALLNQLWSLLLLQQLVILLPVFSIHLPANAELVFNVLLQIAAVDIIPIDYTEMEGQLDQIRVSERSELFARLGLDSVWLLPNLGALLLYFAMALLMFVVLPLMGLLARKYARVRKPNRWCRRALICNLPIRLLKESYIIILICCLVNIASVDSADAQVSAARANLWLAYILLTCTIVYPALQQFLLYRNRAKLRDKRFQSRYLAAYQGLDEKKNRFALYPLFFYYRRVVLVFCTIYFQTGLITQFLALELTGCATVVLLSHQRPFRLAWDNKRQILEEGFLVLMFLHSFWFTDYVAEPDTRHSIGYSLLAALACQMIVSLAVPAVIKFKTLARLLKTRKAKKKERRVRWLRKKGHRPGRTLPLRRDDWVESAYTQYKNDFNNGESFEEDSSVEGAQESNLLDVGEGKLRLKNKDRLTSNLSLSVIEEEKMDKNELLSDRSKEQSSSSDSYSSESSSSSSSSSNTSSADEGDQGEQSGTKIPEETTDSVFKPSNSTGLTPFKLKLKNTQVVPEGLLSQAQTQIDPLERMIDEVREMNRLNDTRDSKLGLQEDRLGVSKRTATKKDAKPLAGNDDVYRLNQGMLSILQPVLIQTKRRKAIITPSDVPANDII